MSRTENSHPGAAGAREIPARGAFIVLLGPDGSGKSTVRELLVRHFQEERRPTWHFHWRPGLLPRPGPSSGRSDTDAAAPPAGYRYGALLSLVRFFYYLADFVAGYWLRIHTAVRRGEIVIGERWYFDTILNPQRYGFRLPAWLLRAGGRLVPAPDLTILLVADPDEIHGRKPELSVGEISLQLKNMAAAIEGHPSARQVSSAGSPADTVTAVLRLLDEAR